MIFYKDSYLQKWKTEGYRYILVMAREKYGVLRPSFSEKAMERGFTIEISEMKLLQTAEHYFLVLEKDLAQRVNA